MPHFTVKHLKQRAVYYAFSHSGGDGDPIVSAGVEINCRREYKIPLTIEGEASTLTYDTMYWVASAVIVGSIIWFGAIADLPATPTDLKEVVFYGEIPGVKARRFERIILLNKWNDSLPTISS